MAWRSCGDRHSWRNSWSRISPPIQSGIAPARIRKIQRFSVSYRHGTLPGLTGAPAVIPAGASNLWKPWGERRDLNPRHPGPQPGALPTELRPPSLPKRQQDARCPEGHRAAPRSIAVPARARASGAGRTLRTRPVRRGRLGVLSGDRAGRSRIRSRPRNEHRVPVVPEFLHAFPDVS
jgi:hypothetical protein